MAQRANERRGERIAQSLCIYCGARPQFWGQKCIICRQLFAKDPLPSGAKRALRVYRHAEERRLLDGIREDAQAETRKLLASGKARGKAAEALRLYMGLGDDSWRTYRQIGGLLKVSAERVRQLLLPAKTILGEILFERVPWPPLEQLTWSRKCETMLLAKSTCSHRKEAERISDDGSYPYEECGISSVLLFGLTVHPCPGCRREVVSIPRVDELNRILARTVLLKPATLSGRELRFLRTVVGISSASLALKLDVAFLTIVTWETSETLRVPNDLAARTVIAAQSFAADVCAELLELLKSNQKRDTELREIRARWLEDEGRWTLSSEELSSPPKATDAGDFRLRPISA